MYIPDPIELMERRIERIIDEDVRGDKGRCCGCQLWFDLDDLGPASAHPACRLICKDCENTKMSGADVTG